MKTIFIVGNSRSGTTMMGRILGNHDNIHVFPELHFFEELWSGNSDDICKNKLQMNQLLNSLFFRTREGYLYKEKRVDNYTKDIQNIFNQSDGTITSRIDIFKKFLSYETKLNGSSISCEQTPRNIFYIKDIFKYFDDVKVINMVRDPRKVLLSQKRKWKRRYLGAKNIPLYETFRSYMNYHPITISKIWNASVTQTSNFDENDDFISIRYEDFIADPEKKLLEITKFLTIDYDESMLMVPHIGSSSIMDKNNKLGIKKEKYQTSKFEGLNNTEIYICQKINSEPMKAFLYNPVVIHPNYLLLLYYYLSFPVIFFLSLLINIKRIKNIRASIKRRLNI